MRDFITKLFACIVLGALLVACGRAQLDESQIVGKWVAQDDQAGVRTKGDGPSISSRLVLHGYRRFSAVNFPRSIFFHGDKSGDKSVVAKAEGAWKHTYSVDGLQQIELDFETGENLKGQLPFGLTTFVTGTQGSPALPLYFGDPDSDPSLDFVKKPEKIVSRQQCQTCVSRDVFNPGVSN